MRTFQSIDLRIWLVIAGLLALGAAEAQKKPVMPEDYMALKSAGSPELSPDGRWVVYTLRVLDPDPLEPKKKDGEKKDEEKKEDGGDAKPAPAAKKKYKWMTHLWLVPADGSAEPRQLTFGDKDESGAQWSPDGKFISFITSRSRPEAKEPRTQIWLLPMAAGEPYPLTEAKEGVSGYKWSPDGKRIAFLSTDALSKEEKEKQDAGDDAEEYEQDFRFTHIWTIDVASKEATQITSGKNFMVAGGASWSPDGRSLAFTTRSNTMLRDERRDTYIVDIASKALQKVTQTTPVQGDPQWSPDGKTLAIAQMPKHERDTPELPDRGIYQSRLYLYDIAGKILKDVSSPQFDQSVMLIEEAWSKDGKRLLLSSGVGVYNDLFAYEVGSGRYTRVTNGKMIQGPSFSADRSKVVFNSDSPTMPSEIFVAKGDFSAPRQLTRTNPQVAQWALGETEVIQWKSSDGLTIEGILLKPVGYQPGKRYPMVVEIHGGPTSAYTNGFKRDGHFWAGQGWAVLYPNPRGSTNYGEKFMRGNIPDWGGGDYRDIMTGVDALVARGIADENKLGVMGWSYGGYMTAWVVSQTGRFKGAMMGAGLSNNESMYGTTDIPGYIASFFKGYPNADNLALYRERSGITYADKITTPLLILHGKNDGRVPLGQAQEYYRALKIRNKPVSLVTYPRAGHGLGEYYHQLDRAWRQYRWIAGYALGDGPLPDPAEKK